jgi:hypothetical protein
MKIYAVLDKSGTVVAMYALARIPVSPELAIDALIDAPVENGVVPDKLTFDATGDNVPFAGEALN